MEVDQKGNMPQSDPQGQKEQDGNDQSHDIKNLINKYSALVEDKHIYFAPNIPETKLQNALNSYASAVKYEEVLVLLDNTSFGSAKNGALLTDKRVYACNVDSSQDFAFKNIEAVTFIEGFISNIYKRRKIP